MDLRSDIHKLLNEIGTGNMMSTAYDTAWVARLVELGEPIGQQALEWLREYQLPDGTWGAAQPHYYHDRLISTLAAMGALGKWGTNGDHHRLQRAKLGMDISVRGLRADPTGETVGFEMIAPSLLAEVNALGIIQREADKDLLAMVYPFRQQRLDSLTNNEPEHLSRHDAAILNAFGVRRAQKLQSLPKGKINRHVTVAFSAEMVGTDGLHLLDVDNLQESNGSVGHSPAATAHFALYVRPNDPAALNYLRNLMAGSMDGGAPNVAPFDNFERSWTLWNLSLTGDMDEETLALCQPHLDFLQAAWLPGSGAGFAAGYTPRDSDDSGLVYDVLARYGRMMDIDSILAYEKEDHFRCYSLESNPSISANIHVLGALTQAGYAAHHPTVQKVARFLRHNRYLNLFWFDKWHASPYYPTTHAIIASEKCSGEMEQAAIDWIIATQNVQGKDRGSWGYYLPSAEETAYCLQALLLWKRNGHPVPAEVLKRGLDWLAAHMDPPYPPLWIGKGLYCPLLVVRSAILSALKLGAQEELL